MRNGVLQRLFLLVISLCAAWACGPAQGPQTVTPVAVGSAKPGTAVAGEPAARDVSSETDSVIPIGPEDAVWGDREAWVTIVEFSDFQCPYCARAHTTIEQLKEKYGPQNLRVVWKNEPLSFHKHARPAAEAAQGVLATAGVEAFFAYQKLLFDAQRNLGDIDLAALASRAGANTARIAAGLERGEWSRKVDADHALAQKMGINGTPGFLINGTSLAGAQPLEKFVSTIDDEMGKAKILFADGTPRGKLHALIAAKNVEDNKKPRHDDDDDDDDDVKPTGPAKAYYVPVGQSPQRGPADALVTLVVFSDFQCPYCKRVEPTLTALRIRYGDRLRIVWKDEPLPFHPRAVPAAMLAREARAQKGDSGFWAMHDELFERQPKLDDADLEAAAAKIGLNAKNAMAAIAAKKHKAGIDKDMELADDVQASGTPHFFVNGKRMVGAQPQDKFEKVIDEELQAAQAMVGKGTPKAKVYDTIMATADRPAPPEARTAPAVDAKMPFRGAAGAKLVIQEFSDFQCPFCSRVEPTVTEILKDYGTRVKIVWRNNPLPFHTDAPLAAEAAMEAHAQKGSEGFFKMHGLLFGDQQNLKRARLEEHARTLGLDMARFAKALDTGTHKAAIAKDQDAAKAANAAGTPAFFIGPYFVSGAQPYSKFKKVIEYAFANPVPPPGSVKAAVPVAGVNVAGLAVPTPNANPNAVAKSGDKLVVHYVGKLTDGTVFDSSVARGTPFEFVIGKGTVIRGWEKGLIGMKAGERKTLRVPPEDGYGTRGAPPTIPPNATLVFDVELLQIK